MIEPDMGTLLGVPAHATPPPARPILRGALRRAADASFNRVTVDGETSTSDTLLLFASGAAGNPRCAAPQRPRRARLRGRARGGGESRWPATWRGTARGRRGWSRCGVREARSPAEAERAARRIANSLLVKTALFGGRRELGPHPPDRRGRPGPARARAHRGETRRRGGFPTRRPPPGRRRAPAAARALRAKEIEVEVRLGAGRAEAQVWTCDLSYDYVRINADYTT